MLSPHLTSGLGKSRGWERKAGEVLISVRQVQDLCKRQDGDWFQKAKLWDGLGVEVRVQPK